MALLKIIMSALGITKKYCCPVIELETRIQINDYTVCISATLRIEGNIKLPTIDLFGLYIFVFPFQTT